MLSELSCASYWSYDPRAAGDDANTARAWTYALKSDKAIKHPQTAQPILTSRYFVERLRDAIRDSPLADFLGPTKTLVPVPGSGISAGTQKLVANSLWVPERLAQALAEIGLGEAVFPCIQRVTAVRKSAGAPPGQRPTPRQHYDSLQISLPQLIGPKEFVLIDDVVTKGATMIGAASRLHDAYPDAVITGLAMVRTVGWNTPFERFGNPAISTIRVNAYGSASRDP